MLNVVKRLNKRKIENRLFGNIEDCVEDCFIDFLGKRNERKFKFIIILFCLE